VLFGASAMASIAGAAIARAAAAHRVGDADTGAAPDAQTG